MNNHTLVLIYFKSHDSNNYNFVIYLRVNIFRHSGVLELHSVIIIFLMYFIVIYFSDIIIVPLNRNTT